MKKIKYSQKQFENLQNSEDFDKMFLPALAIDTVIIGFHQNKLKVLLLQYENTGLYALPGGFIKKKENINDAAKRVLFERTGLKDIYLQQFYLFGDIARYDTVPLRTIMLGKGMRPGKDHWLLRRFVSVGYYALVDYTKVIPRPDILADSCSWYSLPVLPPLILDHKAIIEKAIHSLQLSLNDNLSAFNLLPETFTMGELQNVYETILGTKLLRTSFQRKILNLGILEQVAKRWTGGSHKAPYLYRFALQDKSN